MDLLTYLTVSYALRAFSFLSFHQHGVINGYQEDWFDSARFGCCAFVIGISGASAQAPKQEPVLKEAPPPAPAEFNIWTGQPGLSFYDHYGPRIQKVLQTARFPHQVGVTNGTPENFEKVCANGNDVGLGQGDVLYNLAAARPECKIVVIKPIAKQCLFGVTNIPNMDNLYKAMNISYNLRIGISPKGSGARGRFENILTVTPELKEAAPVDLKKEGDKNAQLVGIKKLQNKEIDMMLFTGLPNPEDPVFAAINDAGLTFVSIGTAEIFDMKAGEKPVYTDEEVNIQNASLAYLRGAKTLKTACMDTVIFTGAPDSPTLKKTGRFQSGLIKVLADTPAEQFRPEDGVMT